MDEVRPGIPLSAFVADIHPVATEFDIKPDLSFDAIERMGPDALAYRRAHYEDRPLSEHLHHLPMDAFAELTFDELAKIHHSSLTMMSESVRATIEDDEGDPQHHLVYKIQRSMWKWGSLGRSWNQLVDAYDGIRRFDLGLDGFTVELDHAPVWHGRGPGHYSGTYLDGTFGYLVRWKGEHVMTLGFSVGTDRRILIHQIQNRTARNNRWMFRLPKNRVEFTLDRFRAAFPLHSIHLVDGGDVARKNLNAYDDALTETLMLIGKSKRLLESDPDREYETAHLAKLEGRAEEMSGKIAHIRTEVARLTSFYADAGRHGLGAEIKINGLRHYETMFDLKTVALAA